MKKPFMFLDTSFKSYCCYISQKKFDENQLIKKTRWDASISRIKRICPIFSEEDYVLIDTPLSNIEFIGMGNIKKMFSENDKSELNNCFPKNHELISWLPQSNDPELELINYFDEIFENASNKIHVFYSQKLNIQEIINKAEKKITDYPCHENTYCLRNNLQKWINDLKGGTSCDEFQLLLIDLTWDSLIRHRWEDEFINSYWSQFIQSNKEENDGKKYMIVRLLNYYLNLREKNRNLSGSILLSKLCNSMPFKKDEELLDPNLIEYACMGYFDEESQIIKPVIVVCCEKDQKDRIIKHVQGIKKVNEILGKPALSFCPGYLLYLDQRGDYSKDEAFNIQTIIDDCITCNSK